MKGVAIELLVPNVLVHHVVQLAKPHGQLLPRVHRNGTQLPQLLLQMFAAQFAWVVLAQRRHHVSHAFFVVVGRVVRVLGGQRVQEEPGSSPDDFTPRTTFAAVVGRSVFFDLCLVLLRKAMAFFRHLRDFIPVKQIPVVPVGFLEPSGEVFSVCHHQGTSWVQIHKTTQVVMAFFYFDTQLVCWCHRVFFHHVMCTTSCTTSCTTRCTTGREQGVLGQNVIGRRQPKDHAIQQ